MKKVKVYNNTFKKIGISQDFQLNEESFIGNFLGWGIDKFEGAYETAAIVEEPSGRVRMVRLEDIKFISD